MHISETRPFILREGSNLTIPTGIETGELNNQDYYEVPLQLIEQSADVYNFITEGSSIQGEMTLLIPAQAVEENGNVSVTEVNFGPNIARAKLK